MTTATPAKLKSIRCTGKDPDLGRRPCLRSRRSRQDPVPAGVVAPLWATGVCPVCGSWTETVQANEPALMRVTP